MASEYLREVFTERSKAFQLSLKYVFAVKDKCILWVFVKRKISIKIYHKHLNLFVSRKSSQQ